MNGPLPFPASLREFQRLFPNDAACAAHLERVRWPGGFACPSCGPGDPYRFANRPGVLRCRKCKKDVSLTADTAMERTHTPLSVWFWGAYLMTTLTPGLSATQFQRQLDLSRYETAFQILHKLRATMVRPERDTIGGKYAVEVDETLVGGVNRGDGKGIHHKVYVLGAVEVRLRVPDGRKHKHDFYAGRIRLQVMPDRTAKTCEAFVTGNITPRSLVKTDGWQGYDGLSEKLGYNHDCLVLNADPQLTDAHLPLIHVIFSNMKAWINGTHHGRIETHHLQAYLNEYVFRFNRRFWPMTTFNSVLGLAAHAASPTYDELYSGAWTHPTGVETS
jgi:hypothetical protein